MHVNLLQTKLDVQEQGGQEKRGQKEQRRVNTTWGHPVLETLQSDTATIRYKPIAATMDCCRTNNKNIGHKSSVRSVKECFPECTSNPDCTHVSFSAFYSQCMFCSECHLEDGKKSERYESWEKLKDNKIKPTIKFEYMMIQPKAQCCEKNDAAVFQFGNGAAHSPKECHWKCDQLNNCNYYSHSAKTGKCSFCSMCSFTSSGEGENYTTWQKKKATPQLFDSIGCFELNMMTQMSKLPLNPDGIKKCRETCKENGYIYFGSRCPHDNGMSFNCQCGGAGSGDSPGADFGGKVDMYKCQRGEEANTLQTECTGPFVIHTDFGAYSLGTKSFNSIYKVEESMVASMIKPFWQALHPQTRLTNTPKFLCMYCVQTFASTGGCEHLGSKHSTVNSLPLGCQHCSRPAKAYCRMQTGPFYCLDGPGGECTTCHYGQGSCKDWHIDRDVKYLASYGGFVEYCS